MRCWQELQGSHSRRGGYLVSRFLLGLGSSRSLAAAQERVFITTALCRELRVQD